MLAFKVNAPSMETSPLISSALAVKDAEPACRAVTVIAPPRIVTGSVNVMALMSIAPEPDDAPMVIDENPSVSAAISFASRSKVPVAESPIPWSSSRWSAAT